MHKLACTRLYLAQPQSINEGLTQLITLLNQCQSRRSGFWTTKTGRTAPWDWCSISWRSKMQRVTYNWPQVWNEIAQAWMQLLPWLWSSFQEPLQPWVMSFLLGILWNLANALLTNHVLQTVLSADIFSGGNGEKVRVSGLWWIWLAITVPLTLCVVASWWFYKRQMQKKGRPIPPPVLWLHSKQGQQCFAYYLDAGHCVP